MEIIINEHLVFNCNLSGMFFNRHKGMGEYKMNIKSLGLVSALVSGAAVSNGMRFDFLHNPFVGHSGVSDRPRGKGKDTSWRKSAGYKSRKAKSNNRKAKRK